MSDDKLKAYYWEMVSTALRECARSEVRGHPDLFLWYVRRSLEALLLALLGDLAPRAPQDRTLEELFKLVAKHGLLTSKTLAHARATHTWCNKGVHPQPPGDAPREREVSSTTRLLGNFIDGVKEEQNACIPPEVREALQALRRSWSEHPPQSERRAELQTELETLRRDLAKFRDEHVALLRDRDADRVRIAKAEAERDDLRENARARAPQGSNGIPRQLTDVPANAPETRVSNVPRNESRRRRSGRALLIVLPILGAGAAVLVHEQDGARVDTTNNAVSPPITVGSAGYSASDASSPAAWIALSPDQSMLLAWAPDAGDVALAVPVDALEISSGPTSWHVGLPHPLTETKHLRGLHEVSTADGLVIRLYACSIDTWQNHRDRFLKVHEDPLSFGVHGSDRGRLFSETCLVGMKGAHICLRVVFRSGQDQLGQRWLSDLGHPKER